MAESGDATIDRRNDEVSIARAEAAIREHLRKQLGDCLTASIPDFGRVAFNLSRNSAYEAANRGVFPTIRVGKLRRVPLDAAARKIADAA